MAAVISDELQELFKLRDHRVAAIKKFSLAEENGKTNMQQNSRKDFIEIHDLDVTHKLMKSVSDAKHDLEVTNQQFEQKKKFFISLLETAGCPTLACTNKEWDADGKFEYVPYRLSIAENDDGETDLLIQQDH